MLPLLSAFLAMTRRVKDFHATTAPVGGMRCWVYLSTDCFANLSRTGYTEATEGCRQCDLAYGEDIAQAAPNRGSRRLVAPLRQH